MGRAFEANALHGGGTRLSVRAVKAAGFAFIGAKRRALTGKAEGSGAEFSQEGYREEVFYRPFDLRRLWAEFCAGRDGVRRDSPDGGPPLYSN